MDRPLLDLAAAKVGFLNLVIQIRESDHNFYDVYVNPIKNGKPYQTNELLKHESLLNLFKEKQKKDSMDDYEVVATAAGELPYAMILHIGLPADSPNEGDRATQLLKALTEVISYANLIGCDSMKIPFIQTDLDICTSAVVHLEAFFNFAIENNARRELMILEKVCFVLNENNAELLKAFATAFNSSSFSYNFALYYGLRFSGAPYCPQCERVLTTNDYSNSNCATCNTFLGCIISE